MDFAPAPCANVCVVVGLFNCSGVGEGVHDTLKALREGTKLRPEERCDGGGKRGAAEGRLRAHGEDPPSARFVLSHAPLSSRAR